MCTRSKISTHLAVNPWAYAHLPVALADVNEVERQCKDLDEWEVMDRFIINAEYIITYCYYIAVTSLCDREAPTFIIQHGSRVDN